MAQEQIHKYDKGTKIVVTIIDAETEAAVDLSAMDTLKFRFQRPDATTFEVNAAAEDLVNGQIKYVTLATTFNQAGYWKLQAEVADSVADTSHLSEEWKFRVWDNIEDPTP